MQTQTSYWKSGSIGATIAGKAKLLQKWGFFLVPPNSVHGIVCKAEGILIDVFSPVREDFL